MTARVAQIWRHPIKGHGREPLASVTLAPGQTVPWDRAWAVAHEASKADGSSWAPCPNFSRGAKAPALMAVEARLDEAKREITLTHPDRSELTFRPDEDARGFLDWVRPLMPQDRAASAHVVPAPDRGMTDTPFPSISLCGLDSLEALSGVVGQSLSPSRFRANFWIEGTAPWAEFGWVGQRLRVGAALIEVRQRIGRCLATHANPHNGRRDADVLGALEAQWGHTDFGVYGVVIEGGAVSAGDVVEVMA